LAFIDDFVISPKGLFPSFPWKRESSLFNALQILWIPACGNDDFLRDHLYWQIIFIGLTKSRFFIILETALEG
jgi:hypothetical protein